MHIEKNPTKKKGKCNYIKKMIVSELKIVTACLKYFQNNFIVDCIIFRGKGSRQLSEGCGCLEEGCLGLPGAFPDIV